MQATAKSGVLIDSNLGYIGFGYDSSRSSYEYRIYHCESDSVRFDKQPPTAIDGVDTWTLIKTEEAFIIGCNGMELLELKFGDADAGCTTNWAGALVGDISFNRDWDKGSLFYRPVCKY